MIFFRIVLLACLMLMVMPFHAVSRDSIDLSGIWKYNLTNAPSDVSGEGSISLPNTLDFAHRSIFNPESDNTEQLRREFSFIGEASFSREIKIPEDWKEKNIYLIIERTKPASVYVDGKKVGHNSRISSSQKYDLTKFLKPGIHNLEIRVNNGDSIPKLVAKSSSALSETTQTNWNGIIGKIFLTAHEPFHIENIKINDSNHKQEIPVTVKFSQPSPSDFLLTLESDKGVSIFENIKNGDSEISFHVPVSETDLWSANNPVLHNLNVYLKDKLGNLHDSLKIITGFRDFSTSGKKFTINGTPVFLRGTVNFSVFPLTAYSPMDIDHWLNYFSILKMYGLNHVRFHSWTPPEAAFIAADKAGVYILTELPIWGEFDRDLEFQDRFLKEELNGIMEDFALHPSFVLFSPGNELWGDISLMGEYMEQAKHLNPRILTSHGSNVYLGMKGQLPGDDFLLSAKTDDNVNNSVRGSIPFSESSKGGHFNSVYPNSDFNYSEATKNISIPIIAHEVGQYQIYPDFSDIESYTGILKPDNLKEFEKRAVESGIFKRNKEFSNNSGKWAAQLYKAEMEQAQRSDGIAGFELSSLTDYPGQGGAFIGILNPFLQTKGLIDPSDWKNSSSDVMILAEFPKFSFLPGETVKIPITVVNYSHKADTVNLLTWKTDFVKGSFNTSPGFGILNSDTIEFKIPVVKTPVKKTLQLFSEDKSVKNSYDFWIYPEVMPRIKDVRVTDNLNQALDWLEAGEKVILYPDSSTTKNTSIGGLFTPDFWSYSIYYSICKEMNIPMSPGTLGLNIQNSHPALKKFPTESHSNWQWWPIVINSKPIIIDKLPVDMDVIVGVIDNIERSYRLGLIFECNVGKGKLMLVAADMDNATEYPEGKWLLQSLKEYMSGKNFKPKVTLTPQQLVNLLTKPSNTRKIKELINDGFKYRH